MTAVFWVFFQEDGRRRTQREKTIRKGRKDKNKKRQHTNTKKKKKKTKQNKTNRQKYLYEVLYLSTHTS